jgi:hypothetical protein
LAVPVFGGKTTAFDRLIRSADGYAKQFLRFQKILPYKETDARSAGREI